MDYEKKYKDALEWLRNEWYLASRGEMRRELELHFPELKESDDERARKEMLDFCKTASAGQTNIWVEDDSQWERWIAWLEKLGEQPRVIYPKFRIGDTIRLKDSAAEHLITDITGGRYCGKGWCLDIEAADASGDYELVGQKWKPSEIQIDAIEDTIGHCVNNKMGYTASILRQLLEQLKKL